MRNKRWIQIIMGSALLAVGGTALAGCNAPQETQMEVQKAIQKPAVKISEAQKRSIGAPQETVAEVTASAERDVVVKASGDVLKALKKRGDQVKQGELLFELDPADVLLQKQKAEIGLRTAQNNLKEGQFAAQDDPDALQPLKDQIRMAQIDIEQINRTLDNYKVTAPISGILTDFSIEPGMTINQGIVGKIQQINPVKIKANITEENAKLLKGKTELSFYAADRPDQLFKGKIVYFADIMDTMNRTYELELQADNASLALKPGTKVQLRLTDEAEQEVLTIPTTAIIREESNTYVYLFSGGKVEKRQVELGRLNELYQEVIEGLAAGDQIVVSGQHQLKDNQEVEALAAN
ncbi:efflux RND transporter periplasmic adaptor subunit [Paenibacillus woosongensis]|uniref:Efflux RND transporter periplasmic adaptor subunit n=1 Tax=Paenibacillus woosongensis TaxID=307580 RepID=A0A7X2Z5M5_9BACL|nr:efflux RND transporter periplasmic adaptor subunit [Paenibacillus woosongensis]MUG47916.1 efflux RND transporter periplasmic adaptor subunit [Paenibacillus woosongensis]